MSMFRSISATVTAICAPVTRSAEALDQSLEMATSRIHRRAIKDKLIDQHTVQLDTAKQLMHIREELNSDDNLMQAFKDLNEDFGISA